VIGGWRTGVFLLWIGYAMVMGFAVGGSLVSGLPTPQPATTSCPKGSTGPNCLTSEQRHEAAEAALNSYTKWLTICTAILAAATIALGIATIGLYLAGKGQLRHLEDTAERQLRAYIAGPIRAEISNFNTRSPTYRFAFKNSGQTPAHDVRFWTTSAVAIYPLDERPTEPPPEYTRGEGASVGVVGPGGEFFTDGGAQVAIAAEERDAVVIGRAAFYVYGEMTYRDAFNQMRHTTFGHLFHGVVAMQPNGMMPSYHKWNEAT
jgi:hypothetical protein